MHPYVIQREHKEWLDREFPGQEPIVPAIGMVEEAGELLHCLLALERERKWGPDKRYPDLRNDLLDAVGDCGIYVCSMCNTKGWSFDNAIRQSWGRTAEPTLLKCGLELVKCGLHVAEYLGQAQVHVYVSQLHETAKLAGIDVLEAVSTTWQKVKERKR